MKDYTEIKNNKGVHMSTWKTDNPKLCGWGVIESSRSPYDPPEMTCIILNGNVRSHRRFRDGENINTSCILGKTVDGCIRTVNTTYELGLPSDEYEKLYPDAKSRLLNSLEVIENA